MQYPIRVPTGYLLLLAVATMLSLSPQPILTAPNIVPPDSAPFAHRIKITLPPAFQLGNADPSSPTGGNSMMLDADKIDQINININNSNNNNNEPTSTGADGNGTSPVNNNNNDNNNGASTSGSTINININNNNNNNNDPEGPVSTPAPTPAAPAATAPAAARN